MQEVSFNSPAKINLFLQILGKREDGYHELCSLFQTISLMDTLHFTISQDTQDHITCTDPTIATDGSNLIAKAIGIFREKTGFKRGVKVHLIKRIPHQAGLGGGSSNAATTLWALNCLTGHPVPLQSLIAWSSLIGSDVPFFLSEGTAYCTGRGEKVRPMPPLPPQSLWVVKPSQGTSTPQVYKALDTTKLVKQDPLSFLKSFYEGKPRFCNDLEKPAFATLPFLQQLKTTLLDCGFSTVLLSGSGSSFFCIGDVTPPSLPNVISYPVHFINREKSSWY